MKPRTCDTSAMGHVTEGLLQVKPILTLELCPQVGNVSQNITWFTIS